MKDCLAKTSSREQTGKIKATFSSSRSSFILQCAKVSFYNFIFFFSFSMREKMYAIYLEFRAFHNDPLIVCVRIWCLYLRCLIKCPRKKVAFFDYLICLFLLFDYVVRGFISFIPVIRMHYNCSLSLMFDRDEVYEASDFVPRIAQATSTEWLPFTWLRCGR